MTPPTHTQRPLGALWALGAGLGAPGARGVPGDRGFPGASGGPLPLWLLREGEGGGSLEHLWYHLASKLKYRQKVEKNLDVIGAY